MRRILFFALAICMLLGVASCGSDGGSKEASEGNSSVVSESQSQSEEPQSSVAEESSEEVIEKEYDKLDKSNLRNEFTTDEFLIGSWVSFYSFDKDSYQTQLDKLKELGINFNFFPRKFGEIMDAQTIAAVEAEYAKRNM